MGYPACWPPLCIPLKKIEKTAITGHANPEGDGPQHSKERGRRGSTGPPQPEQRCRKHHQQTCSHCNPPAASSYGRYQHTNSHAQFPEVAEAFLADHRSGMRTGSHCQVLLHHRWPPVGLHACRNSNCFERVLEFSCVYRCQDALAVRPSQHW